MEIGKPIETITVEPVEDPFKRDEPAPAEPSKTPAPAREREPEKVPA